MRIGVPAEIKNNEYRVGMTPSGARESATRKFFESAATRAASAWPSPLVVPLIT